MRVPSAPSTRMCWRSLSSLALSMLALTNLPEMYTTRLIVPAIGLRLMWTSNTDMKIETRNTGSAGSPPSPSSSRGGGTRATSVTTPSAGATITPSPRGVTRTGSRKKAIDHSVMPSIGQAIRLSLNTASSSVTAPKMRMNLWPSGCGGANQGGV